MDDGKELHALAVQHWQGIRTLAGEKSWIPTIIKFRLLNGNHLNRIDDDTFQIVETGEIVKRKV